jgi:hypothetical protein
MPANIEEKNGDSKLAHNYEKMRMMVSWLSVMLKRWG